MTDKEEPKKRKITEKEMTEMCHSSEKYKAYRKYNTAMARKSRYAVYDKTRNVITDPKVIKLAGRIALCALKDEFLFSNIVFRKVDLSRLSSISRASVTEWTTVKHILPPPMFKAQLHTGTWYDVYLLEEMLVMLKNFAEGYDRMHFFRRASPECHQLNVELESVRNEIKRRLRANEPTIWTQID